MQVVSCTVKQPSCICSVTIAGFPILDSAIWQWISNAFSPNYTYLTCRNFVCQYSVMPETTLKQRTFIVFEFQHSGIPGFFYVGAILAQWTRHIAREGFCQTALSGGEVGTLAFRLFPQALLSRATECSGGNRGGNQGIFLSQRANLVIARTDLCMREMLPCLQSRTIVFMLLSVLSGAIYLRLKPHLVVKISNVESFQFYLTASAPELQLPMDVTDNGVLLGDLTGTLRGELRPYQGSLD